MQQCYRGCSEGEDGNKKKERWTEGKKERDRGVSVETCVCVGGGLLRFHMPAHSHTHTNTAPLFGPTFADNKMQGSFRGRVRAPLALPPELECSFDITVSKRAWDGGKYHQIILGKSSATVSPALPISFLPCFPSAKLPETYTALPMPRRTQEQWLEKGEDGGTGGDGKGGKQEWEASSAEGQVSITSSGGLQRHTHTHACMYRAPPISRGIKNTLAENEEERGGETEMVKEGNGKKSGRANGTKGVCSEMGLDDAKVGKRIQRAQSRFTESHYLPQITWATSLK